MGLIGPMCEVKGRGSLPSSFLAYFEWTCARVLKAKTLIGYCILLKKVINMKIAGVIH